MVQAVKRNFARRAVISAVRHYPVTNIKELNTQFLRIHLKLCKVDGIAVFIQASRLRQEEQKSTISCNGSSLPSSPLSQQLAAACLQCCYKLYCHLDSFSGENPCHHADQHIIIAYPQFLPEIG